MHQRIGHGEAVPVRSQPTPLSGLRAASLAPQEQITDFGYMFGTPGPADQLEPNAQTVAQLRALAKEMKDEPGEESDSGIPAAYTYFGQFVDHDVTLEAGTATMEQLADPNLRPLGSLSELKNKRTAAAELDSVYFLGVPRNPDNKNKLRVGKVSPLGGTAKPLLRPPGKKDGNDLPRQARHPDPKEDRAAIIGDERNDENTIVAQMHTAFLKAHNTLVDRGADFDAARDEMILRYQSVILDDFAKRICDADIHALVMNQGPRHWRIDRREKLFMPAEFAFAAYRFGHSMIRTNYDFNLNFNFEAGSPPASLELLFTFTALKGQLGGGIVDEHGFDTLPENWIIEWERLLPSPGADMRNRTAHAIDTRLTNFLFQLRNTLGEEEGQDGPQAVRELAPMLAMRNLLRGYRVGLPTGQALARRLGLPVLEGQNLLDALPTNELRQVAEPFKNRSPLWFYVLAEAGDPSGPKGRHLGPLGSTIVMETLHNLVRHAGLSVLEGERREAFRTTLADIIELAAQQDR